MSSAKIHVDYYASDNHKYSLELTPTEYLAYREEQQLDSSLKAKEIRTALSKLNTVLNSRGQGDGIAKGSGLEALAVEAKELSKQAETLVEPMREQRIAERQASKITPILPANVKGSPNPFGGKLHYAILSNRNRKATYVSVTDSSGLECCKAISPNGYGYLVHVAEGVRAPHSRSALEVACLHEETRLAAEQQRQDAREVDSRCRSLARAEGRAKPRGSRGKKKPVA